jgi:hypothetical protein
MDAVSVEDLKGIFGQAVKLAETVPPSMQGSAFFTAVTVLFDQRSTGTERPSPPQQSTKRARTAQRARPARGLGKPGPQQALEGLLSDGFFASDREVSAMVAELANSRGYRYTPSRLANSLVRLVRQRKLKRTQNAEGRFVYKA